MGLLDNRLVVLWLRAIQALFAIIILGLTTYVVDWWSDWWNSSSPSSVNFLLFCAIWTLLVLLFLILVPWRFSGMLERNKYAGMSILVLEALTMIFWFAGFLALAVFLGHRVCFGGVCKAAKAATVFGAFEWVAFTLTTVLAALHFRRTGTTGTGKTHHSPNNHVVV